MKLNTKKFFTYLIAFSFILSNTIYALEDQSALRVISATRSPVLDHLVKELYEASLPCTTVLEEHERIKKLEIVGKGKKYDAENIDREKLLEKFTAYGKLCEEIKRQIQEIEAADIESNAAYIKAAARVLGIRARERDFSNRESLKKLINLIKQKASEGKAFGEWIKAEIEKMEEFLDGERLDIVAVVPFYNEGDTIGGVVKTTGDGLNKYFADKKSLIINYGERAVGADNLRRYLIDKIKKGLAEVDWIKQRLESAARERNMENQLTGLTSKNRAITIINLLTDDYVVEEFHPNSVAKGIDYFDNVKIYTGLKLNENRGKGYSLLAGMIIALYFGAKGYACYDADLKKNSIQPEWMKLHLESILEDNADMVVPFYRRHPLDGTITNNLVFPIIAGLYKKQIRQPIGGEYGFGIKMMSKLISDPSVLLTDKATWGTDNWFVSMGIAFGARINEAIFEIKDHNESDKQYEMPDGSIIGVLELMFIEVAGVVASEISDHIDDGYLLKMIGRNIAIDIKRLFDEHIKSFSPPEIKTDWKAKIKAFQNGFETYDRDGIYKRVLTPKNYTKVSRLARIREKDLAEGFRLDAGLWSSIVYDFLLAYRFGNFDIKNELLPALMRIYQGRAGSFARDYTIWIKRGKTSKEAAEMAEEVFRQQMRVFSDNSESFIKRWGIQKAIGQSA